jgi:probable phosphoglycerate mutase
MIRHASTGWNESGRIQGQTDVPLSALGRAQAAAWRLPPGWVDVPCITSPLRRARETAELLGFADAACDSRLAEMGWGAFEGRRLDQLRAELGPAMAELERLGLDFQPPGGESPRAVAARLSELLRELAATADDRLLVTHKGVLRACLVLAFRWDMRGKPPVRLDPDQALTFRLDSTGDPIFLGPVPLRSVAS